MPGPMPEEPNRNVEDQLRAFAQKRRDEGGPPFELHPATRKLLQDEVARTLVKPKLAEQPAPEVPWWKILWPRLAIAGSICALLVVITALVLPGFSTTKTKSMR